MNNIWKKSLIAMSCSAALFLTACNSDDKDNNGQVVTPEKTFISEKPYTADMSLDSLATVKVMTYNMQNVQGKTAEATAMVMFPKTAQPKDGWRVVVWEHGTVGVADQCAPSVTPLGKNFRGLAEKLLAAGYVIVAPDYEGLGTKGIHPYLNLASEAKSALAAVKAVKQHYGAQLNGAWMSAGQSQGGQASLGTAEYANNDPFYKGAVAGAPASSLGKIILDVAPQALRGIEQKEIAGNVALDKRSSVSSYATLLAYAALTGVGIKAYEPRFEYRSLFQTNAKELAAYAEGSTGDNGLCLQNDDPEKSLVMKFQTDIIKFMQADLTRSVMDYPGLDTEAFRNDATVSQFLKDSQPGTKRLDKPVLIVQGTADTNVPYIVTQAMVDNLQNTLKSPNVKLILVDKASHTQAIVDAQPDVLAFIAQYMPAQ